MEHDEKYQKTLAQIRELFNDTDVEIDTCRERLNGLRDEIDLMLESLPDQE